MPPHRTETRLQANSSVLSHYVSGTKAPNQGAFISPLHPLFPHPRCSLSGVQKQRIAYGNPLIVWGIPLFILIIYLSDL